MRRRNGERGCVVAPDSAVVKSTVQTLNSDPDTRALYDGFYVVDVTDNKEVNGLFQTIYQGYPSAFDQEL